MRISTTVLESFRLFMQPDQEWMPEEELLATIRGEFTPTPKMLTGQAFGRCLEKPTKYRVDGGYRVPVRIGDGWFNYFFSDSMMAPCLEKFDRRGVFETPGTKKYGDLTVVCKADQILGTCINENKAKLDGQFDFQKYNDSYQWRFMLDIFDGATSVTYNVFLLDEDDQGTISLRGCESFSLYPYAELHADCCELLNKFVDYVTARGLVGFLRERQQFIEREYTRAL